MIAKVIPVTKMLGVTDAMSYSYCQEVTIIIITFIAFAKEVIFIDVTSEL